MIWTLVRKELLDNLLTLRLTAAFIFTIVLLVLTTFVGSLGYSRNVDAYRTELDQVRESLEQARTYSSVHPSIVLLPQPLSILCRGLSIRASGQRVWIGIWWVPSGVASLSSSEGKLMKTFVRIDFTTVVAVLLSFLAVVLGFDGICGERERGTLQQVIANPVPRGHIVVAKLVGGMLSLWVPLTVAFVFALLILLANPNLVLAGEDWGRLVLFFLLSCLFLGQVFALSLMVSAFTRSSATSLIVCLFVWLVGSVGYMNVLPSLSRYGVEGNPFQEFLDQQRDVWNRHEQKMEGWEGKHPRPAEPFMKDIERDGVLRYGHPVGYAWRQKLNAVRLEKILDVISRVHRLEMANYEPLVRQVWLVDHLSILSPFTNYRTLAKQLALTTLDDLFFLTRAGIRYREAFIQYLRGKNAFSSRRWFSDDPEDQEPLIPHPDAVTEEMLAPDSPFMKARMKWAEEQQKKAREDPRRRLDLTDMPKFGGKGQHSLAETLEVMTPGLAVLVLTFGLSVLVTITRFLQYDPR